MGQDSKGGSPYNSGDTPAAAAGVEPVKKADAASAAAPGGAAGATAAGAGVPAAVDSSKISDSAQAMMKHAKDLEAAEQLGEDGEKDDGVEPDPKAKEKLEEFVKAKGNESAERPLGNLLKVLERLLGEPKNAKLHKMRLDVLERILDGPDLLPVLVCAGFEKTSEGEGKAEILKWGAKIANMTELDDPNVPILVQLKSVVKALGLGIPTGTVA